MRELSLEDLSDRMTKQDLLALVGEREHERLDFKRSLDKDDQRHVVAMAMTDGGWLVAGVDDERRDHDIHGWELTQERRDLVQSTLSGQVGVTVGVRAVAVDGRPVTVVAVPAVPDRVVTTTDGRILRRRGTASVPLVGDEVTRFVRERSTRSSVLEELPYRSEQFDWELVAQVLEAAGREHRHDDPYASLAGLGLASSQPGDPRGRVVKLAALLLFGRQPTEHVEGALIRFVRREGRDGVDAPVSRRQDLVGPLLHVVEQAVDAVMEELAGPEVVIGRHRRSVPRLPESAIREAVLNAVAHRDYGITGANVDLLVTDTGVTIQSPGSLPGHITLENIREEHYSRNKPLMDVLSLAGYVEQFGDGVDRIYEDMAERLLPEPTYTASQSSVTLRLSTTTDLSIEEQVWLETLSDVALDRDDRRVLLHVRGHGSIARRDAGTLGLGAPVETVLRSMVSRRLLDARGRRGGRHYVLSPEVVARAGDTSIAHERRRRETVLEELRRRDRAGLTTRAASEMLGDDELRHARTILNDLVRSGEARAEGNTTARRYFAT